MEFSFIRSSQEKGQIRDIESLTFLTEIKSSETINKQLQIDPLIKVWF